MNFAYGYLSADPLGAIRIYFRNIRIILQIMLITNILLLISCKLDIVIDKKLAGYTDSITFLHIDF